LMGDSDLVTGKLPDRSGAYEYRAGGVHFSSNADGVFEYGRTVETGDTKTLLSIGKTESSGDIHYLFMMADTALNVNLIGLSLEADNRFRYFVRYGGTGASSEWTVNPTEGVVYTMVGVTRSATDHELFVDGVSRGSSSQSQPTDVILDSTIIGAVGDASPNFGIGTVYAGMYWNRALSNPEIESISHDPYQFLIPA